MYVVETDNMTVWVLFILGGFVLSSSTSESPGPCSFWDDAVYIKGKCFKAFTDEFWDWEHAEKSCAYHASSGRLAEIVTVRELDAISRHLAANHSSFSGFVGGRFNANTGKYEWTLSSTPTSVTSPGLSASCITYDQISATFKTSPCESLHHYICEQVVPDPCEYFLDGGEYHDGTCFLVQDTPLPHSLAQIECEKLDGFLAEPRSKDVETFLLDLNTDRLGPGRSVWLGADSNGVSGPAVYLKSGLPVPAPNGITLAASDCLTLSPTSFNKDDCSTPKPYICQREIGNPCEVHYPVAMYHSGHCYEYIDKSANYADAEANCNSKNGHIVEMKDQVTEDFVINYMINQMKEYKAADVRGSAPVWVGLTYLDLDMSTRWRSDGAPVDNRHEWPEWHENFAAGDLCGVMTSHGVWEQRACHSNHVYICQSKIANATSQRYLIPLGLWQSGEVPSQVYITATTALHSTRVHLVLSVYVPSAGPMVKGKALLYQGVGYSTSLRQFLSATYVAIVETTHPVTLTLTTNFNDDLASTLIYPTMRDNNDWVYNKSYYVIASPYVTNQAARMTIMVVATEPGSTALLVNGGNTAIFSGTLTQYQTHYYSKMASSNVFDGTSVSADKEIAVFVMQNSPNDVSNYSLSSVKQWPPHNFLGTDIIAMPSNHWDQLKYVSMKVVSTEPNSYIAVPFSMKETYTNLNPEITGDEYAQYLSNQEALDVALISYDLSGVASSLFVAPNAFALQSGNEPFFSIQAFSLGSLDSSPKPSFCTISPLPQAYWRKHYETMLFPDSEFVLDLSKAKVHLYLVLETDHKTELLVDGEWRYFDCVTIPSTYTLSGCVGELMTSFAYNKPTTLEMKSPFGAYLFVSYDDKALFCHPLGFQMPGQNLFEPHINMTNETVTLLPPITTTMFTTTTATTSSTTTTPTTTTPTTTTTDPTTSTATTTTTSTTPTTTSTSTATSRTSTTTAGTTSDPCTTMYYSTNTATHPTATTATTTPTTVSTSTPNNTPTTVSTSTPNNTPTTENTNNPAGTGNGLQCATPTPRYVNITEAEERQLVVTIQKELEVIKTNTTLAKRKKTSAQDDRSSSKFLGVVGIVLFSVEVLIIVIPDGISIYRFICH